MDQPRYNDALVDSIIKRLQGCGGGTPVYDEAFMNSIMQGLQGLEKNDRITIDEGLLDSVIQRLQGLIEPLQRLKRSMSVQLQKAPPHRTQNLTMETPSPSTLSSSSMSPPMSKVRKVAVPTPTTTETTDFGQKYLQNRIRGNENTRRCRERQRLRNAELLQKTVFLEKDNLELAEAVRAEMAEQKELIAQLKKIKKFRSYTTD